ncbi:DUF3263 domain-containing protein [Rhodococcus sp. WS3]|nr:DUF3263 domain-containing protein [Rhodococcus sp. WS3]
MDIHDRAMLDFAITWRPYGGSDDQIFPEFGVSIPAFYGRVLRMLDKPHSAGLDYQTSAVLREFCSTKLRQYGCSQKLRGTRPQTRAQGSETGARRPA